MLQSLVSLKSDALAPVSLMLAIVSEVAAALVIAMFCAAGVALIAVALKESAVEDCALRVYSAF